MTITQEDQAKRDLATLVMDVLQGVARNYCPPYPLQSFHEELQDLLVRAEPKIMKAVVEAK